MSDQSVILRDDSTLQVVISSAAHELKATAIDTAALICKVTNAVQQEAAVAAQTELRRVIKLVEDSRVAAKAPVLDYGRKIDATAKTFVEELKAEEMRVSRYIGDFQTLEQSKIKAAEAARNSELTDLERRREEELSQAANHDERDAIQARYNEEAAAVCGSVKQAPRVDGQVIKEDWEIEVTDAAILARCHYPTLCEVRPRLGAIKDALRNNQQVYGIKATPIIKAGVRLTKEKGALTV